MKLIGFEKNWSTTMVEYLSWLPMNFYIFISIKVGMDMYG